MFGVKCMRSDRQLPAISSLATVDLANGRTELALPDAQVDHWSRPGPKQMIDTV